MSKRCKIIGLVLAALIVGFIVVVASWSREPSYHGRTLTNWLKQFSDASLDEVQRQAEAEAAIRAIGVERAVPHLLRMAEAQDGPLRSWIIRKTEHRKIPLLSLREAEITQLYGIAGFEALGTNCVAAVPHLARLMEDTNHAFTALRCLVGIGEPAATPVCQALTNRSTDIRRFAASQLAWVTDDIDVFFARLNCPLSDPDATVRFAAVQVLGLQMQSPNEVIPLLVKAMQDPEQSVSGYAAKSLGDLGTNGIKAFDALRNVVMNGNPYMATHALRSLVFIAPDHALPMALGWLRSSDADRRARAAGVLGQFPSATKEILDALKAATTDADSKVANLATSSLRQYRQKEREQGVGEVVIEGEPSYGGRRLGAWLKDRPDKDKLSEEAVRAIRGLGTNAIPTLLARLVYKDPRFGLADYDASIEAMSGFYVLGEAAAPALPRLEEILNGDDPHVALFALMATCKLGTSSAPILTRALTNRNADVRNQAVGLFREGPMQSFPEARRKATPLIAELLCDPDYFVRMGATNALKGFDAGAAVRAGLK
jgi:HEAT repeat protein